MNRKHCQSASPSLVSCYEFLCDLEYNTKSVQVLSARPRIPAAQYFFGQPSTFDRQRKVLLRKEEQLAVLRLDWFATNISLWRLSNSRRSKSHVRGRVTKVYPLLTGGAGYHESVLAGRSQGKNVNIS